MLALGQRQPPADLLMHHISGLFIHRRAPAMCVLLWLLLCASWQALAQSPRHLGADTVTERAWLDDPDSSLSAKTALARAWTPLTGPLSQGFTRSTTWLRLKVDPTPASPAQIQSDTRLVLRIRPGHLDEVAIYRTDQLEQAPLLVGDSHERIGQGLRFIDQAVVFDNAVAPFELLLRVRTKSNHSIDVQAIRWDAAREEDWQQLTLVVGFLIFTAMVILWAGLAWLAERSMVLGLFIAHQCMAMLVAMTLLGVVRLWCSDWMTAGAMDLLTSVMVPIHMALMIQFHAQLLSDLGSRRGDRILLQTTVAVPAVALLLIASGHGHWGLKLTQAAIPAEMALLIVLAWRVGAMGDGHAATGGALRRGHLVGAYVVMTATTIVPSLRVLGLFAAGSWTYNGFLIYGIVTAVLMGSLLKYRATQAELRRKHAESVLAKAEREADLQRARAEEQSELMSMLTHELKTPLSVLLLSFGSLAHQPQMRERALRSVETMRNVIDRCAYGVLPGSGADRQDELPEFAPIALGDALAEAVSRQVQTGRIVCRADSALPTCLADRQLLMVIIGNLLDNAIMYGLADTCVRASVERADFQGRPGVALCVTNAVGPAGKPDPTHLFLKYQRGSGTVNQSGTGLGLYLSRQLARRMGGELAFHDGEDVRFQLWLPS